MSEPLTCAECGTELPVDSVAAQCPECLVRLGLDTEGETDLAPTVTLAPLGEAERQIGPLP